MSPIGFIRDIAASEVERAKAQVRAAIRGLVLTMVAIVFLLIGVVFTLAGTYATLTDSLPGWQAGGIIGLGTLVACLVLLMAARLAGSRASRQPPAPRRPSADDLEATAELGAAASSAARDLVRDYRPSGLELTLAAFVVGMVFSRRRRRRG